MSTMTITTNQAIVLSVSRYGCTVAVNGENKDIAWDALIEAARQDVYRGQKIDGTMRALAEFYRSILGRAREMVAEDKTLPIRYAVQRDETNVWWVAYFRDVTGSGSWIPRDADEGGTLAHAWMADMEAEARATRLRRMGYAVEAALR
jgi:hypothetical protein